MTGSKQDIAIKIFGDDLNTLSQKAADVENVIQTVPGFRILMLKRSQALPRSRLNIIVIALLSMDFQLMM